MLIRRAFSLPRYASLLFLCPLSARTSQLACEEIPRLDSLHRRRAMHVLFWLTRTALGVRGEVTQAALRDMMVVVLVILHLRH